MEVRALTQPEQKYTYSQSTQIAGQTGCIGHLRGDFDSSGNGFYTTWDDHWDRWKTDEFKAELDEVINTLREGRGLLHNIDSGVIPKFAGCVNGSQWFKDRGQWQEVGFTPEAGQIIFFDWEGDGETDHVGIVERCENGIVYTVEGNSGDACRQRSYPVGSRSIYGYGIPAY